MAFSNVGLGVVSWYGTSIKCIFMVHLMVLPMRYYYHMFMEFNKDYTGEKFREIARAMGVEGV